MDRGGATRLVGDEDESLPRRDSGDSDVDFSGGVETTVDGAVVPSISTDGVGDWSKLRGVGGSCNTSDAFSKAVTSILSGPAASERVSGHVMEGPDPSLVEDIEWVLGKPIRL